MKRGKTIKIIAPLATLGALAIPCTPAAAFFHLWNFTEVFSNADGSVQFVELGTSANGEHFANGSQIRSQATGNLFTFPSNLSSSQTANRRLLIATPGFEDLPGGLTPDFLLPTTNFFDPAGDTLTLFLGGSTFDSKTFSSLPTDGVLSRHYPSGADDVNSPTNFTGAAGSVDLSVPALAGDYNDNGRVEQADLDLVLLNWNEPFDGLPAEWIHERPSSGIVDQAELDSVLLNWNRTSPTPGAAGVPEPNGVSIAALSAATFLCGIVVLRSSRRSNGGHPRATQQASPASGRPLANGS